MPENEVNINQDQINNMKLLLSRSPKYDSEWIDIAAELLVNYENNDKINEEVLSKFTASQLRFVRDALNFESIDFDKFINSGLNATQMQLIIIANQQNIDPELLKPFYDAKIPFSVSNYIIQALSEGYHDMINYINYNAEQVYEIYAAHKENTDYTIFDDIEIDASVMQLARHALVIGSDVRIENNVLYIEKKF